MKKELQIELENLILEHSEKWAKKINIQMNKCKTWEEVKALYEIHNKEIEVLIKNYEIQYRWNRK